MSHEEFVGKLTRGDKVFFGTLTYSGGEDHAVVSVWNITMKGLKFHKRHLKHGRNASHLLEDFGFRL